MNGAQARTQKLLEKIDTVLSDCPKEVVGFSNYLDDIALETKYNYLIRVRDFLQKTKKDVQNINFEDYVNDLSNYKYKDNGEEKTVGSRRLRYFALKKFSEYLYDAGIADDDYMLKVKKPKGAESETTIKKRDEGFLTQDEVRNLMINLELDIINSDGKEKEEYIRDRAMFYVFLTTGIRRNALVALDISNIDLNSGTMIITDKGRKVRKFNLNSECVDAISEYLDVRRKYMKDEKDALFIHKRIHHAFHTYAEPTYERIRPTDVDNIVKQHTAFTGRVLSAHKLRATFGTQLYNKTKDIYFVQKCMGHASPQVTERYIRGEKDMSREAADIMSDLF